MSPRMHNAVFARGGADYVYVAMDVAPRYLLEAVEGLRALGFVGFNVTMPHKNAVLPLLDELDASARLSGSVNTVVIQDGRLRGFDTDGSGFVEACGEAGVSLAGRRVVIVGAGGAAAAIAVAALGEGAARLHVVNRTFQRAGELCARLSGVAGETEILARPIRELGEAAAEAEVIVNATYLGMKEEDPLPVPGEALTAEKVICDAVYRAGGETKLVRQAREAGARIVSGGRMLLFQGVQAQRVWTGREPDMEVMSDALA